MGFTRGVVKCFFYALLLFFWFIFFFSFEAPDNHGPVSTGACPFLSQLIPDYRINDIFFRRRGSKSCRCICNGRGSSVSEPMPQSTAEHVPNIDIAVFSAREHHSISGGQCTPESVIAVFKPFIAESLEEFAVALVHKPHCRVQSAGQITLSICRRRDRGDGVAQDILIQNAHPHIIAADPAVHAPRQYLRPGNRNTGHRVFGFTQRHDRLLPLLPTIPELDRRVKTPRRDNAVAFAPERAAVDPPRVARPPSQGLVRRHVPEEHRLVAAYADEAVVVCCDAQVVDFIAVGAVFLHQQAAAGVEKADRAVGAAGQELCGCTESDVLLVFGVGGERGSRIGLFRRCSRGRGLGLFFVRVSR